MAGNRKAQAIFKGFIAKDGREYLPSRLPDRVKKMIAEAFIAADRKHNSQVNRPR
jgi:hypothetical protein